MLNIIKKYFKGDSVASVAAGKLEKIEKCIDIVFAEKKLGDGFIIKPVSKEIVSPVDGEITLLFPTNHAIGIKDNKGSEYLIHIGVDTVLLNGNGFKSHVQLGQQIKKGQLLMEVDFESIKNKVKAIDVIVIATDGRKCIIKKEKEVKLKEDNIAVFR